jgi:nucleotide-binding universal stress UspA family protein
MNTNTITPGAVVVGYSGERDADHALAWAAEQAALENRPLALVHVLRPVDGFTAGALATAAMSSADLEEALAAGGRALLAEASERVAERFPGVRVDVHLVTGTPEHVLRDLGEHAALVVVGSRGRGRLASALLGSVSLDVASGSTCPVVVVRPYHRGKVRRGVLVGTDCTRDTRTTLEFAYREASLRRLPLTVLHAVPGLERDEVLDGLQHTDLRASDHRRELAETIAGMTEKFPDVPVRTVLTSGDPEARLVEESAAMDLVVVGHHHRARLVDRFALGSYAPALVERAGCPTAVVFEAAS